MGQRSWTTSEVVSRDGTTISFLTMGRGPALVVLPGNNRRAHHYQALAAELSATYTIHVLDRRGRGLSGPQGSAYSVDSEVDDALAVMQHTGAERIFGHSYGGLIAMHLALRRDVAALVVYEPNISIDGSIDGSWLPQFTRLLDAGRPQAAMATFLKRTRLAPIGDAPMIAFRGLAFLLLHGSDGADTRAMMATTSAEVGEVVRLDSDGTRYAAITSPALLLGGGKSPSYLTDVLPILARIMPNATSRVLPGLDHNAPDLNAPVTIATEIGTFGSAENRQDGES